MFQNLEGKSTHYGINNDNIFSYAQIFYTFFSRKKISFRIVTAHIILPIFHVLIKLPLKYHYHSILPLLNEDRKLNIHNPKPSKTLIQPK